MNLNSLFSVLGISKELTQDLTLLIVIVVVSFLLGLLVGRHHLVTMLANIYVGVAILGVIPDEWISSSTYLAIIFLAIIAGMTFFGEKLFEIYISGSGAGYLGRIFAMSFLEVVLILSVIVEIIPKKEALNFISPTAYGYLADSFWPFIWMILPLFFLVLIQKRINR